MRLDRGPETCAVCRKSSEWSGYICNRCLDASIFWLLGRHPFRSLVIGWLHVFNRAPGDRRLA